MIFSVTNDTLNGIVNEQKLYYEFTSANYLIEKFTVKGDVLEIFTSETQSKIELIVNAHDGSELPHPRILDLFDNNFDGKDFRDLDYTIKQLYPKRTFVQGELQLVEWYLDSALTTMVLSTSINYTRDNDGFATSRTTTRTWYNTDNSVNPLTKTKTKYYTQLEMIKEGKRRRENIVNGVQLPILNFLKEAALDETASVLYGLDSQTVLLVARDFMDRLELEFIKFIHNSSSVVDKNDPNYNKKTIVVAFEYAALNSDQWLNYKPSTLNNSSVLEYLVSEFSIWFLNLVKLSAMWIS